MGEEERKTEMRHTQTYKEKDRMFEAACLTLKQAL